MSGYRLYSSLENADFAQKYAQIDLTSLRENYCILRDGLLARAPSLRAIAVVKADAYGHGAPACVRALLREGCDFFAVSCFEEAVAVRRECDALGASAEILILGYTDPREAERLVSERLLQTVLSEEYARALDAAAQKAAVCVRVHVAINTGMNRIGLDARSSEEFLRAADALLRIKEMSGIDVCGM